MIADREADFFDYFAAPRRPTTHLLVRAHHPGKVLVEAPGLRVPRRAGERLPDVLARTPSLGTLEVAVPRRPGHRAREARLEVRGVQVWLLPADLRKADDPLRELRPLPVWVVEGREPVPPAGVEPLHWVLVTTQEVTDLEGAARVLGYYRRRWGIEDLSLVLKSGLQAERLQMDDADTLKNTLALLYVVAWRVLYVRDLARLVPEAPAETLVNPTEQAVLEAAMGRPLPTVGEVVHAIATLGGFSGSPSAGPPGVRTLWDGLQRLEGAVLGWRLAQRQHAL